VCLPSQLDLDPLEAASGGVERIVWTGKNMMTKPLAAPAGRGVPANFVFRDLGLIRPSVLQAVTEGLESTPKRLPAWLLYDARGAQLFEFITRTQDYYVTRTEALILAGRRCDLAGLIDARTLLLEYGPGEMRKIRLLLAAAVPARYVAVDISVEQLLLQGIALARDFPRLLVEAVHADFAHLGPGHLGLPEAEKRLFFLPGSTIGNLEPREAEAFLRRIGQLVRHDGCAVVGVDLCKEHQVLERAYNDSAGYTARFNLNLLLRINRELAADFVLDRFEHVAFYNAPASRIEMHLRSRCEQSVRVGGRRFTFAAGETIHTENSYKYLPEGFAGMAARAGFEHARIWSDPARQFGVFVLQMPDDRCQVSAVTNGEAGVRRY
jgi:dimethylhistidine N-methyltransferase